MNVLLGADYNSELMTLIIDCKHSLSSPNFCSVQKHVMDPLICIILPSTLRVLSEEKITTALSLLSSKK